jgi:pyruvate formate lyase activating enzyme
MHAITNIQKFSIHDGDGIRTTVFFKGCPLKCVWCHNPETQKFNPQMEFNDANCGGCGFCVRVCPSNAIHIENGKAVTDESKCTLCGKCVKVCPASARDVVGREHEIKHLMKELLKDQMFYEESGGGVTLSGGEVMSVDPEYVQRLVKELHREGIDVTIDTCGYAPYERFEAILPYVSTFLYDVKAMDPEVHKKYMGVDNELILENLCKLSQAGARIYIRIPMIKEVNATKENIQATIDFLREKQIRVAQVNLLPYHDTGSSKYKRVGMTYEGTELSAPSKEEMQEFQNMFINAGYANTKIGG